MRTRHRFYIVILAAAALAAVAGVVAIDRANRADSGFPGEHWEHIAPDRAGFDPDLLAEFVAAVGGHGLVVRNGRVVTWWGHYAHPLDVASACKPVYAHFLYAAIEDGLVSDLDEPLSVHVPELGAAGDGPEAHDCLITWRHLLQQTACYGVGEPPGAAFNYSDYQIALLGDTIVLKVHNSNHDYADKDIVQRHLARPLRFEDEATLKHERAHPGRLCISARDFARFGLLYLNEGRWRDRQRIPREVAIQAVSSPLPHDFPRTDGVAAPMLEGQRSLGGEGIDLESHMGSYSYAWWVNGEVSKGRRLFPDLPDDMFLAQGHSGRHVLLVIPSLDLVVCWIDAFRGVRERKRYSMEGHELVHAATRKLLAAMAAPEPPEGR